MENQQLAIIQQEELNEQDINLLRSGALAIKDKDTEINDIKKNISVLRNDVKNLETQRKVAENALIPIMNKGAIDELNISTGKIKYIEREKKTPLNKKNLNNLLESFFMNEDNLNLLINMEGMNNIEIARKRTKYLLEFFDNNSGKKKIVLLKSEFTS